MRNLPLSEVEADFHRRARPVSRWEWLKDSIHYFDFWKDVAVKGIVPGFGVFLGCVWVGWVERRNALKMRT